MCIRDSAAGGAVARAGAYHNAAVLRTNAMKYLPNYFALGSLVKLFFCFPDPHFKAKNWRRRIVSDTLLSEYASLLAPGGRLYAITDVEELHKWHVARLSAHASFARVADDALRDDPAAQLVVTETEEGKKVERAGANKFLCVFRRVEEHEVPVRPLFALPE